MWDHLLNHVRDFAYPDTATEAIAILGLIDLAGAFKEPKRAARLRARLTGPEFASLQDRPEFRAIVASRTP